MRIIKKEFSHIILEGNSYEVGRQQAELIKNNPAWIKFIKTAKSKFSDKEFEQVEIFFEKVCPGLNDELKGMADYFNIPIKNMSFYYHSYLRPHCSTFCVLPQKSADGHVYVCRNYDFNYKVEDYRLCTTKISGKFSHTGFSTMLFGRNDGLNDQGLCVTMSSTGMGVGATKWLRSPALSGSQFWLILRGILENCRDVTEAIAYTRNIDIAYNIHLLMTDKKGNACLVETFDGQKATEKLDHKSFLGSTNHALIPEIKRCAGKSMKHSVIRYRAIEKLFRSKEKLSREDLQRFCSQKYPDGIAVLYYRKFLGTTYSIIFDLTAEKAYIAFGSPNINPWKVVELNNPEKAVYPCTFIEEVPPKDFMEWID